MDQMKQWDYIVEVPPGPGGDKPHEEGGIATCERCTQQFVVKRRDEADQCRFHWGRAFSSKANGGCSKSRGCVQLVTDSSAGEKRRVYTCCARTVDEEGCEVGPHVFYEKEPEALHRRHAFTHTRPPNDPVTAKDSALEVVALDCEMIYSTGGMRVARVSVVDAHGEELLDEFIRMDEGVEVM